jgi:hypothetical protein
MQIKQIYRHENIDMQNPDCKLIYKMKAKIHFMIDPFFPKLQIE